MRLDGREFPTSFNEGLNRVSALTCIPGGIFDEKGKRDFERINPPGNLRTKCLEHLGDDQHGKDLLPDHHRLCRPEQVEAQVLLDKPEGHLDVPAYGVEFCQCQWRQLAGFRNVGNVAVGVLIDLEFDQAYRMTRLIRVVGTKPDAAVEGGVVRVKAVNDFVAGFESET